MAQEGSFLGSPWGLGQVRVQVEVGSEVQDQVLGVTAPVQALGPGSGVGWGRAWGAAAAPVRGHRAGLGTARRLQGQLRVPVTSERVRAPGHEKPSLPQDTWSGVCSGKEPAPLALPAPEEGMGPGRGNLGAPVPPPLQACASEGFREARG